MAITYKGGNRLAGLSSDSKPVNLANGSVFVETDTGKESILQYGSWSENNKPNNSIAELLGDQSEPLNQHFIECFQMRHPPYNSFSAVNVAGSGHTSVTQDAIDGGLRITTSGSSGDRLSLDFTDASNIGRLFDTAASDFIWVVKTDNNANGFADVGISDNVNTSLSAGKSS